MIVKGVAASTAPILFRTFYEGYSDHLSNKGITMLTAISIVISIACLAAIVSCVLIEFGVVKPM